MCLVGCCGRSNVVDTLSLSVCFSLPSSLCSRWYFDGLATLGSSRSFETQIEFATSRFVAAANHIAWQYQFILAFIMAKMKDRAHHQTRRAFMMRAATAQPAASSGSGREKRAPTYSAFYDLFTRLPCKTVSVAVSFSVAVSVRVCNWN